MKRKEIQVANYGDWVQVKWNGYHRIPQYQDGAIVPVVEISRQGNAVVELDTGRQMIKNEDIAVLYIDPRRSGTYPDKCIAHAQNLGISVVRELPRKEEA